VRFLVRPKDDRVRCDFNGLSALDNEEALFQPTALSS
jgi:hypothetical protein